MPKIAIDVDQILLCAVYLSLEPGDQVLIKNGVIIAIADRDKPEANQLALPAPVRPVISETLVLSLLRQSQQMTTREIAEQLGIDRKSRWRLRIVLQRLIAGGQIQRIDNRRYATYRIIPAASN